MVARKEVTVRPLRILIAALGVGFLPGELRAETRTLGGVSWNLSSAWRSDGESWVLEGEAAPPARLVASVIPGSRPLSSGLISRAGPALEAELRSRGFERPRVEDSRRVRVGGGQAWRAHLSSEVEGRRLAQILYVVEARETVALTLTCDEADFEPILSEIERFERSLIVTDRPSAIEDSPASLCGALLGLLAGASCAAWRRGKQRAVLPR